MCLESSPFIVSKIPCGCGGRLKITSESYVLCTRCGATMRKSHFYENIGIRNKINIKPLGIVRIDRHYSGKAFCESGVAISYKKETYHGWWLCICPECKSLCFSLSPLTECSPKVCKFIERLWLK